MNVNDLQDKEKELLKSTLKRTVRLCKAIWTERDTIEQIKAELSSGALDYAQGLWDDLDLETQQLLITAPSKGGAFTTEERAQITEFWTQVGI